MPKLLKGGHRPDYFLIALIALLTLFGLVILTSASSDLGKIKFGNSYYYLEHQLLNGLLPGIIGFFIAARFQYQKYRSLSVILLIINLGLLLLVFTPLGVRANGSSRWLHIGSIIFQPAELLKLSFIVYLAAWLSTSKVNRHDLYTGFLPFVMVCGVTAALLILQPATSIVVILLSVGLAMYFVRGAKVRYIAGMLALGMVLLAIVVYATPYRLSRIKGFLSRGSDSQGANYHLNQALIAIGSGQWTGVGYGRSTAKVNYLPAVVDDSIFAVAAQELGFIGAGTLILLFGLLTFRMFYLAQRSRDNFGRMLLIGFGAIIALQSLVNMGAISGLLPLTGVPLPFISYGGTALAVFLTMAGIAVNVSKYA